MEDEATVARAKERKVIVVGAGVAGRAAANALHDLGVAVVLVDRSLSPQGVDCPVDDGLLVTIGANVVGAESDDRYRLELESMQGGCRQRSVQEADAVILATGLMPIDAGLIPEFGMGWRRDVISAPQLLAMLESEHEIRRPSDGAKVSTVVFIQCVGSRVERRGVPYCCAVGCADSIGNAIKLKERDPSIAVYVLYIDIRTAGKGEEAMYKRARQLDVKFIRGQPALVGDAAHSDRLLVCGENTLLRELYEIPADLVVLALGLREDPENLELFRGLGVELDREGLIKTGEAPDQAVQTSAPGVFLAGSASAPMGAEEAASMGAQAAHAVFAYLRSLS
ncbi:MAG: FAD-dependent oxidoreductase [Methanomassiliicoccales archaeon]|nr:FAD-dependent oxidoreductase [Methanomassiliicoccales archaeon]